MATLQLVSNRTAPEPQLFNPPIDDVDDLIDRNCAENRIEAAMRIRALTEISGLETEQLLGLARLLDDDRRRALLVGLLAGSEA